MRRHFDGGDVTDKVIITNIPEEFRRIDNAVAGRSERPGTGWAPNLRRAQASEYLLQKYGIILKPSTMAKWWCLKSDGPPAYLAGRVPLYPRDGLDAWAIKYLGPLRTSTSGNAQRAA
jgi:hypothetical protein